jgi:putative ABC transport system permease protein
MNARPPKLPMKFLLWYCKESYMESIQGDLEEEYEEDLKHYGTTKAKWRFTWNVIRFFRPGIIKSFEGTQRLNNYGMFKNYFKVGIRNILKYKMFSFINVFGLAVAMSVCMLIILMLYDQKSYDQFHEKKDRVYRILGTPEKGSMPYATIPLPLAESLKEDYPIIEEAISLRRGVGGDASYNQKTVEMKGFFTSTDFFDIFSFPLIKGDESTALDEPNSLVITKEKAYQLFNSENPIGKQVTFEDRGLHIMDIEEGKSPVDWGTYTVTGVIDLSSHKTHLKFDALVSSSTLPKLYQDSLIDNVSDKWEYYYAAYSFVSIKEGVAKTELDIALAELGERKYADSEKVPEYKFSSQSLIKITPGILVNNEASFRLPKIAYYVLSLLALVIMVMACLNYTNLSIARSLSRMKEIGVRKVTGATRQNLIFQFLTESVITVMISLIAATVILFFTKEAFMGLWFNKYLNFDLSSSLPAYLIFVAFSLLVGIIAGTYPALFLSKREPISALKSIPQTKGKWGIQKFLNVSQFVVSLVFIVTSMVIYNQFKHYTEFEYGFNSENIINIPLQSNDYETLVREFSTIPGVNSISACDYMPASGVTNSISLLDLAEEMEPIGLMHLNVSQHFLNNLDLTILSGEGLDDTKEAGKYIVINESAVEKLGYKSPDEAIGKIWKADKKTVQIIGVVENFRAELLINGDEIRPLALNNDASTFNYLNVKISEGNPLRTIADMEEKWEGIDAVHEFKYDFYDNELANTNLAIFDIVSIIGYISFLAILIACLGLLGMATYTTERKTKEVGIRKVLGAAEMKIVLILSKGFLKLLGISILIAAPLSYFINKLWLDNLPNRVDFGFGTVVLASLILLGLGLLTIGSQTIRAARRNPVESLKDE